MKITITSTDKLTEIDGVPGRIWLGVTDAGTPCFVFVHRVMVKKTEDQAQFERELQEQLPPGRHFTLREIL